PDFTDPAWQAGRADAELISSILDGKGASMPPAGDDVTEEVARGLVSYVRTFAAPKQPKQGQPVKPGTIEPRKPARRTRLPKDEHEPPPNRARLQSHSSKLPEASLQEFSREGARPLSTTQVFRRDCAKCHGDDGTGQRVRRRLPRIPDFTDPA